MRPDRYCSEYILAEELCQQIVVVVMPSLLTFSGMFEFLVRLNFISLNVGCPPHPLQQYSFRLVARHQKMRSVVRLRHDQVLKSSVVQLQYDRPHYVVALELQYPHI